MSCISGDCEYDGVQAYKPSSKTWIFITGITLFYFYIFISYPKPIRYAFVGLPILLAAVYHVSNLRSWLLLLPILITFGGATFEYGPFYIAVATIAVLFTALLYFTVKITDFKRFPKFPAPVYIFMAAYTAQIVSVFVSLHFHENLVGNTIREANKLFLSSLLLPVIYGWYGRGDWFTRILKILSLMLLVMGVYGIYQYNSGDLDTFGERSSGFDLAGRVYSTIAGGPNSYSGVLELLVPTALASMFFFRERIWKFIALAAALIGVQNVMYTFSRGGFLTVAFACILFLVFKYRKKIWVPILTLALFTGGLVYKADEFKRQLTIFGDMESLVMDTSLLHRYTTYKGFIGSIKKSPIVGVGWGSREYFHGRTSLYSFWEVRHEDSIEKINRFGGLNSTILEMPYKGGIFSLIALLLLLYAMGLTTIKLLRSGRNKALGVGMITGLGAFGVHQVVDNLVQWPQTGAFFWLIVALLISLAYPCCGREGDSL